MKSKITAISFMQTHGFQKWEQLFLEIYSLFRFTVRASGSTLPYGSHCNTPKINRKHQFTESSLSCYDTHLQISNYSKQKLIRLKSYSCIKISPAVVTKRRYWFSQLILSQATSVCEFWSLVDVLWVVPTNEAVTMSKPGIARSNK